MPQAIDYYFATISPYAYLGHDRLVAIAQKHGATINVKPINLGGVFPAGYPVGTVSKVERNPAETFATVEAKPLARLDSDYEVVLIWYQPPAVEPAIAPVTVPTAAPISVETLESTIKPRVGASSSSSSATPANSANTAAANATSASASSSATP